MDTNKTFCEECRNDVDYTVTTVLMTGTIKGKQYCYAGKEAHCIDCGSIVFVPELIDANLEALYEEYRKKK